MKKLLKYFLLTILGIIALLGGLITQGVFRFNVITHPINNHIKSHASRWGDVVDLSPEIMREGTPFSETEEILKKAGYTRVPGDKVWKKYKDRTGKNKHVYTRDASTFGCNIKMYVFIEFDDDLKLKNAQGTQHEHGCL